LPQKETINLFICSVFFPVFCSVFSAFDKKNDAKREQAIKTTFVCSSSGMHVETGANTAGVFMGRSPS
jgi:hypothetical protein